MPLNLAKPRTGLERIQAQIFEKLLKTNLVESRNLGGNPVATKQSLLSVNPGDPTIMHIGTRGRGPRLDGSFRIGGSGEDEED